MPSTPEEAIKLAGPEHLQAVLTAILDAERGLRHIPCTTTEYSDMTGDPVEEAVVSQPARERVHWRTPPPADSLLPLDAG